MPRIMSIDSSSIAIRRLVEDLEHLEVGRRGARPDPEHEAPLRHVIELGDLSGDDRGVLVGEADDPGAELDPVGLRDEGGHQHEGGLDGLGGEGEVLSEPHLVEADRIGAADDVHVLVEQGVVTAAIVVDRVHEHAQLHGGSPFVRPTPRGLRAAGDGPVPVVQRPGR